MRSPLAAPEHRYGQVWPFGVARREYADRQLGEPHVGYKPDRARAIVGHDEQPAATGSTPIPPRQVDRRRP